MITHALKILSSNEGEKESVDSNLIHGATAEPSLSSSPSEVKTLLSQREKKKRRKRKFHKALQSWRDILKMAFWNAEGNILHSADPLNKILNANKTAVLGVAETWLKDGQNPSVPGYLWLGRNRENQKGNRGSGGVGFFVAEWLISMCNCPEEKEQFSTQDMTWMKIRGRSPEEDLYLAVVYSGLEDSPIDQIQAMYNELTKWVTSHQDKGKVIIMGDFNARVGKYDEEDGKRVGKFGEEKLSRNGRELRTFLEKAGLFIVNNRKEPGPIYTHTGTQGEESVIDYLIVSKSLLSECQSHFLIKDLDDNLKSDHRSLQWTTSYAGERVHKLQNKSSRIYHRWQTEKLEDPKIAQLYQRELSKEFKGWTNACLIPTLEEVKDLEALNRAAINCCEGFN
jgi:exonuclease III